MKVRVYYGDDDFEVGSYEVGGYRAVKKANLEMAKKPHRSTEEKRKDDGRSLRIDRRPRGLDVRGTW